MAETYTYYKSTHFLDDLYPTQLLNEINALIAIQVIAINIIGDNVDITFASELLDQTVLDGIVAAHVPTIVTYQTPYPDNHLLKVNPAGTIYTYFGTQQKEIHISKDTSTAYKSLGEAIAANNSPNGVFVIHPGTYIENNPIVIPNGSSIKSSGTASNTTIIAQNPNADLVVLGINCRLFGIALFGAYGAGSRGIYFNGAQSGGVGRFSVLGEVIVTNCDICIENNGNNGAGFVDTLFVDKVLVKANVRSLSKGIYCRNGGQIISTSSYISGVPGYFAFANAYQCDGATSRLSLIASSAWFCNTGLFLDDSGSVEISVLSLNANVTGVKFGTIGTCSATINSLTIKNSVQHDLSILGTTANLSIYTSFLDDSKFNNPNDVRINMKYNSEKYGSYYQTYLGNVQVGSAFKPSRIGMGEGMNNTVGLVVLENDNLESGTWVNTTSNALNTTGFNMFSTPAVDGSLYIGSDSDIYGIVLVVVTPTSSVTSMDDIVWEYWDGASWIQFNVMQTKAETPYSTIGDSFMSSASSYQIRFGLSSSNTFATKILNGLNKKWVRLRIVNNLVSIPISRSLKLHVNSTRVGVDGFTEYFGNSRSVKNMPIEYIGYSENSSLANQSFFVAKNLGIGGVKNSFPVGTQYGLGFCMKLPYDIDISFPIKLNLAFVGNNENAGIANWILRYNMTTANDDIYLDYGDSPLNLSTTQTTSSMVSFGANQHNKDKRTSLRININKVLPVTPNYIIWLSLERDPGDTYSGAMNLIMMESEYVSWNNGKHLSYF